MIPNIKKCFDCVHSIQEPYQLLKCGIFTQKLPLSTERVPAFCEDERHHEIGRCGEEGKYFEPRQTNPKSEIRNPKSKEDAA